MNQYLSSLITLSDFDRQLSTYIPKIEQIEATLNATADSIAAQEAKASAINTEIDEIKAQIRHTNTTISELSAKIKDISKKSSSLKTEKEIRAMALEEDLAQDQLSAANEEIARLERLSSTKEELLNEINSQISELQSASQTENSEAKTKLKAIESERAAIIKQKEVLIAKMNQKILSFYEKIRKWAHNTAVVPVRKQACYGCYMKINDKTFAAVIKSEDIITCPHCGRILYKEAE